VVAQDLDFAEPGRVDEGPDEEEARHGMDYRAGRAELERRPRWRPAVSGRAASGPAEAEREPDDGSLYLVNTDLPAAPKSTSDPIKIWSR
jgi:hypothetical protein